MKSISDPDDCPFGPSDEEVLPESTHGVIGVCVHCHGDAYTLDYSRDPAGRPVCWGCAISEASW